MENYRSSSEIVDFFNSFIREDPNFIPARIHPPKPVIRSNLGATDMPVLAMFRPNCATLADHLSDFLEDVFRKGGFRDPNGRFPEPLRAAKVGGDLGDAVLLGFSVLEMRNPTLEIRPRRGSLTTCEPRSAPVAFKCSILEAARFATSNRSNSCWGWFCSRLIDRKEPGITLRRHDNHQRRQVFYATMDCRWPRLPSGGADRHLRSPFGR